LSLKSYCCIKILNSRTFYSLINKTSETISDSAEYNLRLWYSSHIGPHPCRSLPRKSTNMNRIWADRNLIRHNLSSVYVSCLFFLSRPKNNLQLSFVKTVLKVIAANVTIVLFTPMFATWYFCFPHQCVPQGTFVSTKI